jgi:hypothetical protein
VRVMCEPVGFVLHPEYNFTGASADSLADTDGVLEVKCPETTTHLEYIIDGKVPDQYLSQIAWEMACTERRWADFVSFDPRIQDEKLRFFYRRMGRDELEWRIGDRLLTGEAVLHYFTEQVIKLNAEIEHFMAEHGAKPVAPFPVEIVDPETGEVTEEEGDANDLMGPGYAFLDDNLAGVP